MSENNLFRKVALMQSDVSDLSSVVKDFRIPLTGDECLPKYIHPALGWSPGCQDARQYNEAFQMCVGDGTGWDEKVAADFSTLAVNNIPDIYRRWASKECMSSVPDRLLEKGMWFTAINSPQRVQAFGSHMAAEQTSTMDLLSLRAVVSVSVEHVHVPLTCLIYFQGHVFHVECDVGLGHETLVYGATNEATVVVGTPPECLQGTEEMRMLIRLLAEKLGLRTGCSGADVSGGCHTIECHKSPVDDRLYIRRVSGLFPCSLWSEFQEGLRYLPPSNDPVVDAKNLAGRAKRMALKTGVITQRIRPEFMWAMSEVPLSSDAHTAWCKSPEAELRSDELLTSLSVFFTVNIHQSALEWANSNDISPNGLRTFMHTAGVGMKCLGRVASVLEAALGPESVQLDVVRVEMASRCLKEAVREQQRKGEIPLWCRHHSERYSSIAIDLLAKFLGAGLSRLNNSDTAFWEEVIAPKLMNKFGAKPFKRSDLLHIKKNSDSLNLLDPNNVPMKGKEVVEEHISPTDSLLLRKRACALLCIKLFRDPSLALSVNCTEVIRTKSVVPALNLPPRVYAVQGDLQSCMKRITQRKRLTLAGVRTGPSVITDQVGRLLPFYDAMIQIQLATGDPNATSTLKKALELRGNSKDNPNCNTLQILRYSTSLGKLAKHESVRESGTLLSSVVEKAGEDFGEGSLPHVEAVSAMAVTVLEHIPMHVESDDVFETAIKLRARKGLRLAELKSDYADLVSQAEWKNEDVYIDALRTVRSELSETHPEYIRLLWQLATLRRKPSLLARLLPVLEKILPRNCGIFCSMMFSYGKLALQQSQQDIRRAAELFITWLKRTIDTINSKLPLSEWCDTDLRPALYALVYLAEAGPYFEPIQYLALHQQVKDYVFLKIGAKTPFLIHTLRPLAACHVKLAKTSLDETERRQHLFAAGECYRSELQLLLTGCEDLDLNVVATILVQPSRDKDMVGLIRRMVIGSGESSTKTTMWLLKRNVARVLTAEFSDPVTALQFSSTDKRLLIDFWDIINTVEELPSQVAILKLRERMDTLSAAYSISKVWGTAEESTFYFHRLNRVTEAFDAKRNNVRGRKSLKTFLSEEPTKQVEDEAACVADVPHDTRFAAKRSIAALTHAVSQRYLMTSSFKLCFKSNQTTYAPNESLPVMWRYPDPHTRREHAHFLVFSRSEDGGSPVARYRGWKAKLPRGMLTDQLRAPLDPGHYMVCLFEEYLNKPPPSSHCLSFSVKDLPPHTHRPKVKAKPYKEVNPSLPQKQPRSQLPPVRKPVKSNVLRQYADLDPKVKLVDLRMKDPKSEKRKTF